MNGDISLTWFAEQGATFALPEGRYKSPLYKNWQNQPFDLAKAIAHAKSGGNVGLLTGTHSRGILALDVDNNFLAVAESLGPYGNTAMVQRTNAIDRGKLLYRVDFPVRSKSWKPGRKGPPWTELLSNGRHALIPPSQFEGGDYILVDQHKGIATLTDDDLALVWYKATEGRDKLPTPIHGIETRPHTNAQQEDGKTLVLEAWSTFNVFDHHGFAAEIKEEANGEIRLMGNGGLLIKANGEGWYSFADSQGGGDAISAWAYCTQRALPVTGKKFWDVLHEMAEVKGLKLPDTKTRASTNSNDVDATGGESRKNQADILLELAATHAEIFTGQDGAGYAFVPAQSRRECYKLRSKGFRGWLTALYRTVIGKMPASQARDDAITALEWDARGTMRDVFVRVGGHGDKVYIDLGTEQWNAIEVDATGWRIVAVPPVAFRRTASLRPLPLPQAGGSLAVLQKYINVEAEHYPLVAAWAVAACNVSGPYPILVLAGEQGTAKSTTLRVLKELIDPSAAGLRGQPSKIDDLMVGASNGWLLAFDNISHLHSDLSDALCRVATGGGYAKRALHTNDDEVLIDVQRPIAINGIGDIITRPDLMDRCLLLCPPIIPEDKRRGETEFWQEFSQDRSKLLGALLDTLSMALRNVATVQVSTLPRMADFARLAIAAEPAFGAGESFLEAYDTNREEAHATVIETSTMGDHLRQLVLVSGKWEGTATELLQELNNRATDSERRAKTWPSAPNKLKPILQRLAPSLRHIGIGVEFPPRTDRGGTRRILVKRLS